ncbi:MAG: iron-containing alcohol dehydrogenase [Geminicoccaceae bacterium]|nr:iron-containing alcohol dehydrogenase [Geminicoccaceae bacterium]
MNEVIQPNRAALEDALAQGRWNYLIDDIVAGRCQDPRTGRPVTLDLDRVVIAPTLDGAEADLVAGLGFGAPLGLVADEATMEAMGRRIERALQRHRPKPIVLDLPHADQPTVAALAERLDGCEAAIAVGSGTINDLTKAACAHLGLPYCVFGTAASMNGYTSSTASISLSSGLKTTLASRAPRAFFADIAVAASAPGRTAAAGFGDCMARPVAQIDWWLSHRLFGTDYHQITYDIEAADEAALNARAAGVAQGESDAVGRLYRVLTLCGLGFAFTGTSHHGSMGEHQISHYIDCFAGERHPGTLHGEQVGVASLTMARLQQRILAQEQPPRVRPTRFDEESMRRRMGPEIAAQCLTAYRRKALDEKGAEKLDARLRAIWPELRRECARFAIQPEEMHRLLRAADAPTTAGELGLPVDFYREAILHCREMRDRFSMLDVADDAGLLADFAQEER